MKLRIGAMLYGGAGLPSQADEPAIPFTLPGELIETGPDVDPDAGLVTILEPSPHRVTPRCPHFGPCGGCQYQHADYEAQAEIKRGILRDILQHAGLTALPAPRLHTAAPWHYRNRIRLRIAAVDGALRAGYNRRGSYEFLPIRECPIAAPLLLRAAEAVLTVAASHPAWTRHLAEMELFTTPGESRLQLTLFLRSDRATDLPAFCSQLKALVPELSGAGITVIGPSGRKSQPGDRWGADGLLYPAAGRDYWVSRGSFFQVNRFLVDELVRLVTASRSGALAWDLYAGVGLFARALAETFTRIVAVEVLAPGLVPALAAALKPSGNQAVAATTADFLRRAVLERERPDLIVMDPPRAGLGAEVCELLARVRAPHLIYVSCDPTTLARDLRAMVDSGYTVHELHLVDLFPQTFHLETVVTLSR